jgi:hypothetical protein
VFVPQGNFRYPTIDELFDTIQSALDAGVGEDQFSVRYDEAWGYPTDIYVDLAIGIADEETSYYASNLFVP